jgi:hypothetical protein
MIDTWLTRDLPALDPIVAISERDGDGGFPTGLAIRELAGIEKVDPLPALQACNGVSADVVMLARRGNRDPYFVSDVYPRARLALGRWSSGESLVSRLVTALEAAAEKESHPSSAPDSRSQRRPSAALFGMLPS